MSKILNLVIKEQPDKEEAVNDLEEMIEMIKSDEVKKAFMIYESEGVTQLLPLLGDAQWTVFALEIAKMIVLRLAEEEL